MHTHVCICVSVYVCVHNYIWGIDLFLTVIVAGVGFYGVSLPRWLVCGERAVGSPGTAFQVHLNIISDSLTRFAFSAFLLSSLLVYLHPFHRRWSLSIPLLIGLQLCHRNANEGRNVTSLKSVSGMNQRTGPICAFPPGGSPSRSL